MVRVITNAERPAVEALNYKLYAEAWQRKFGFTVPPDLARRWWPTALTSADEDARLDEEQGGSNG